MTVDILEEDIYLFHQGTHFHSYQFLGCHFVQDQTKRGYRFAVWAPHATHVEVAGDFNNWNGSSHSLEKVNAAGLWTGFFTDIPAQTPYKYHLYHESGWNGLKADPYAFQSELRPKTASLTPHSSVYEWGDNEWQSNRQHYTPYESPISIYELHFGTWKQKEDGSYYTYAEMADVLLPYIQNLGYTHIELMPLSEHPFDLSWGYQITGYYSVTSRYGTPDEFRYFVDKCHQANIGVIMDWVPGHFCKDEHGLRQFDGEPLFEYKDPLKADKPSWGTLTFDFGRPEVQSFLISNALFWLKEFHIDGIRVDAVASMIYLNFDRLDDDPEIKNTYGEEENLEAIAFLKKLNEAVFAFDEHILMMAEDSSDVPLITSPTYVGGLGFNFKWNMGWMNDMLKYMEMDPIHRKWNHHLLTFSYMYTYSENFVLPLSHDEVVHGKKSLVNKMPGDQWQQFAQLRLLYGYMMAHPGKKLLFMGGEFAQYIEWKDQEDLDWHLLKYPLHDAMKTYVKELNHFYKDSPALYVYDHDPKGFEWIDPDNKDQSIVAFMRKGETDQDTLIILCNFTPNVYYDYKVGVPSPGTYQEIFNSDTDRFGGSHQLNSDEHFSFPQKWHGLDQHIKIKVPPFALTVLQKRPEEMTNNEEELA
ncbi:1,4-alpha-glucan branching protein GlgB [Paenalkalicoccus suaedae]|uniref:1,4-alpha-glucan branching protein GlgB n=1 Tax=Paenalkalicoccus suaedae TaxID=2592382 RepID=UPI00201C9AFF|nr:1,4-alpha-glucan branching protein GlgB [Paenalkalicoccus suaedae]